MPRISNVRPLLFYVIFEGSLLCVSSSLLAQDNTIGTVKGSVNDDSTHRPLEFVNVLLQKKTDSTLVTGAVTNANGAFELKNIPAGEYFVKLSRVGYEEKALPPFAVDLRHEQVNLDTLSLLASMFKLEDVTVTAERLVFNQSIDRKVYNVDQDMMSKAESASELLENIPSVQVDIDGIVSLRGSSSVQILINGKTSPLLDKKGGAFLEQLSASAIDKIEVITNPSAKYKSRGKAGIINIVLKKNTALGTHGNVTGNVGNGGRYNGQVRVNHNDGDLNIYGNFSLRRDNRNRVNVDSRVEYATTGPFALPSSYYTNRLSTNEHPLSKLVTLGLDYYLDGQNAMGITGNYVHNSFTRVDSSNRILENGRNLVFRKYDRKSTGYDSESDYSISTYIQHDFAKEGHNVRLDFVASGGPQDDDSYFTNVYTVLPIPSTYDNALVHQRDNRIQLTADYSNLLAKHTLLEAGYAGEFSGTDLDFYAESFDSTQGRFVEDVAKTSQFHSNETTHALYVTAKHSFGKFGVGLGIRAEQTAIRAELITLDSVVSNTYLNLYPSLHLSYTFSKAVEVLLSYSRRTLRPNARDLNPFPEYRDPKNVSLGNPSLVPEYIHSIELGFQFQGDYISVLPSLFYRYSSNHIASIKQLVNRSTLLTTIENLSNNQSAGLETIVSIFGGDFFHVDLSATGFYEQLDATNLSTGQNRSALSCSGTLATSTNFTKSSRFQIRSRFRSSRLTSQGEHSPNAGVSIGFRQDLFGHRLFLVCTVADIFRTRKREFTLDIPRLHQAETITRESRVIFFGLTYHIGRSAKKVKEEPTDDDEDF